MLEAYGDDCFTPQIVRKFPAQFTGDAKTQKDQLKSLQNHYDKQLQLLDDRAYAQMISTKSELESKISEIEQKERFVISVKTTNKEM